MVVGDSCFGCRQVQVVKSRAYRPYYYRFLGLNALIEANKSQAAFKAKVAPPTTITINVNGKSSPLRSPLTWRYDRLLQTSIFVES